MSNYPPDVMNIFYFSGSILPSRLANAVHVMKMSEALTCGGVHELTLFAKSSCVAHADIFAHYDTKPVFKLSLSPHIPIPLISGAIRVSSTLFHALKAQPEPDLIYGRDFWSAALWPKTNTRIIFEAHELPRTVLEKFAFKHILKRKNFAALVVISNALKKDVHSAFPQIKDSNIIVAPDGANVPDEMPAYEHIKKGRPVLGYVGSLHAGKGVETLLEIARRMPQADIYVYGGAAKDILYWKEQSPKNLIYFGHVPHHDVHEKMRRCDLLLAPFQKKIQIGTGRDIARWTSPLKLFEYMAAGRPIICSDLPVLREVMAHKHNALLINPDNPQQWCDAIQNLLEDKELAGSLIENAFHDLKTKYSWRARADSILSRIKF